MRAIRRFMDDRANARRHQRERSMKKLTLTAALSAMLAAPAMAGDAETCTAGQVAHHVRQVRVDVDSRGRVSSGTAKTPLKPQPSVHPHVD